MSPDQELDARLRRSLVVLVSRDEMRAREALERAADRGGRDLRCFSLASGWEGTEPPTTPKRFFEQLTRAEPHEILVAFELWRQLDAAERRRLREHAQRNDEATVVLVELQYPPAGAEFPPEAASYEFALPDADEVHGIALSAAAAARRRGRPGADFLERSLESLLPEFLGLEANELRAALDDGLRDADFHATASPEDQLAHWRSCLRRAKRVSVNREGALVSSPPAPMRELGGLDGYKSWLDRRSLAFAPEARDVAIPTPKGVLLIGVQGCGKSLAARGTADRLGLPLFRLEPGRLFQSALGGSEAQLEHNLSTVERLAPVVLWIDELEKGLAGVGAGASDGGTASRVIGRLLTWLQERTSPVFVVATANDPSALPPELLRRGRLDETFFVDLPDADARAAILEIHLRTRPGRELGTLPPLDGDPAEYATLARSAEGFSGAELEAALIEARLEAFAEHRPLNPEDLRRALASTVPLSQTRRESIEALRTWARDRARRA